MNMIKEECPIYRAEEYGVGTLTNIELLSIILGNSNIARELAKKAGDLRGLFKMSLQDILQVKGIGMKRANRLLAVITLHKRLEVEKTLNDVRYDNSIAIYEYMRPRMANLSHEEAWVLLMNNSLHIKKAKRLSIGGLTETAFDIRLILKEALLNNATVIAVVHNHPSGNLQPSKDDDNVTTKLKAAAQTMRIHFLDHIIVTDNGYYSYSDVGRL